MSTSPSSAADRSAPRSPRCSAGGATGCVVIERHTEAYPAAPGRPLRPRGRPDPPGVRPRSPTCRRSPSPAANLRVAQRRGPRCCCASAAARSGRPGGPTSTCSGSRPSRGCSSTAAAGQPTVEVRRGVRLVGLVDGRRRAAVLTTERDEAEPPNAVRARYVVGLRRRQQHGARPDGRHRHRPRLLLRLADRRRGAPRAPGVRSGQPPDLRPDPADDRGLGRARPAAVGVHAAPRRDDRRARRRRPGLGAARAMGRHRRRRRPSSATPSTGSRPAGPIGGAWATCCSPATPPTRCRRSPGRACARVCATPPTSRGSSTSCCAAGRRPPCSTPTRPSASENVRAVIDFSMALGKVICVTDPTRPPSADALMADTARTRRPLAPPPLPGIGPTASSRAGDPPGRRAVRPGPGDAAAEATALFDDVSAIRLAPGVAMDRGGRGVDLRRRPRRGSPASVAPW